MPNPWADRSVNDFTDRELGLLYAMALSIYRGDVKVAPRDRDHALLLLIPDDEGDYWCYRDGRDQLWAARHLAPDLAYRGNTDWYSVALELDATRTSPEPRTASHGYQGTLFAAARMADRNGDDKLADTLWELRRELRKALAANAPPPISELLPFLEADHAD